LALTLRGLGPALLILAFAFRTIPRELLDAAQMDGAGPLRQFWQIAVPCRLPTIAAAGVIAFSAAMADLAASILVVPPGVTTLSIRIFGLLHYGVQDRVAGVCLALAAAFTLLAGTAMWLVRAVGWVER
jgi:iron(III) transport system permease protein